MTRPSFLDAPETPDRPVHHVQTMPAAPPAPSEPVREVIVGGGLRVRSGQSLRQTIRVEHLTPGDVRTIRGDWLPEDAPERSRLDPLRAKLDAAWRSLKALDGEVAEERRSRALDPTGADRPRLDAARLLLDREEAVIRCEAALIREADIVLGELRERLPAEIADDERHAERLVARADGLRAAADEAERVARHVVAVGEWKKRTLVSGGTVARQPAEVTRRGHPPGEGQSPGGRPRRPAGPRAASAPPRASRARRWRSAITRSAESADLAHRLGDVESVLRGRQSDADVA